MTTSNIEWVSFKEFEGKMFYDSIFKRGGTSNVLTVPCSSSNFFFRGNAKKWHSQIRKHVNRGLEKEKISAVLSQEVVELWDFFDTCTKCTVVNYVNIKKV